jgi:hypothetical protein
MHFNTRVPENPASQRKRTPLDQLTGFKSPKTKRNDMVNASVVLANCDNFITPDCLYALYNFYYTPQATEKNSYGIGELFLNQIILESPLNYPLVSFGPQAYLASDLDLFFQCGYFHISRTKLTTIIRNFSSTQPGQRPNLVSIDGGKPLFTYFQARLIPDRYRPNHSEHHLERRE